MRDRYISPFSTRYSSLEMQYLFSEEKKFRTWRRLWVSLAHAQHKLGLPVSAEQVAELERFVDDINYEVAEAREREVRHDVMSHVYAYGRQCPDAAGIIHLGATSCYVGDNADIIIMAEALELIKKKLAGVIKVLSDFAMAHKDLPCLAYTHLQPAQLTTVGKRATLWLNDLVMDFNELEYRASALALLGVKGATGTQASFLELFGGDHQKVRVLEKMIAQDFGFKKCVPVSGQTYSRKTDFQALSALCGVAQSAGKFSCDMRLLQSFKEIEEPFERYQVGSSAMPYKRNPMRCERITALSRHVIANLQNPAMTAASQWFERTLDDSANKRISVSEAFLATDAILSIMLDVCGGLVVYPKVITRRVMRELPFMATENIMMSAVKKGASRQEIHERLRIHCLEAGRAIKEDGSDNRLIDMLANDPSLGLTREELDSIIDPAAFTGRSRAQTEEFISSEVLPLLARCGGEVAEKSHLNL